MKSYLKFALFLFITTTLAINVAHAQGQDRDIAGVWNATTPEGQFDILSVPNRDSGDGYYFLMLKPGDVEEEFGFRTGELLATLTELQNSCWQADERFHLPLWAGGDFFMGETEYCLSDDEDILNFHTDDESAVFTDYPLERIADPINAEGLWHCTNPDMNFDIILYPKNDSGWEAGFVSADYDPAGEAGLEVLDILYRGDDAPDSDGVDALAVVWGTIHSDDPVWLPTTATLENSSTLVFLINQGPEMERLEIEFERIY
ncbi:MAG: hypothetical protein NTY09_12770 [bacterium]|nr:hypothetical protein [bacterium]